MNLSIDKIKIGVRQRTELGNLSELAESIRLIGLLNDIVVTKANYLVCGQRRLEACKELGWKEVPVKFVDIDSLIAERDENTCRKEFTLTERVAIARAIEDREKPKARERQEATRPSKGEQAHKVNAPRAETFPGRKAEERAADVAAKSAGFSRPTYQKAKEIVEAAEKEPEKFGDLPEQMDQGGKVDPVHKEMERRKASNESVPPVVWQVEDDVRKITNLIEKLRPNWQKPDDKMVIRTLLSSFAKGV